MWYIYKVPSVLHQFHIKSLSKLVVTGVNGFYFSTLVGHFTTSLYTTQTTNDNLSATKDQLINTQTKLVP